MCIGLAVGLTWPGTETALGAPQPQGSGWSSPVAIAEQAHTPRIAGDPYGQLHVFYVETDQGVDGQEKVGLSETQAIMYVGQSRAEWGAPVDVLVSPNHGGVYLSTVVADAGGDIHVLWCDDQVSHHSYVDALDAGHVQAWQSDQLSVGPIQIGDMVWHEGVLHIVLRTDLFSMSYMQSVDGGYTWSAPEEIWHIADPTRYAIGNVQLALSPSGDIHLTWFETAAEVNWNFWSVGYARSTDNGETWQTREIASPRYGGSDIAVDGEGNIVLVYGRNIGVPDGRWYTWSSDGGETWAPSQATYPSAPSASGDTGGYGFAVDSAGTLHMVNSYGDAMGDAASYYMSWQGDKWSEPEMLLDTSHHAHFPRLVVTHGNRLNFVALSPRTNSAVTYRSKVVQAPDLPSAPLPPVSVEHLSDAPPRQADENLNQELSQRAVQRDSTRKSLSETQAYPLLLGALSGISVLAVSTLVIRPRKQ